MRTLVIDSATEACSVALFQGDSLLAGAYQVIGRGHAEQLVPMIARLPGKGQADQVTVALGPGSFTGVRIGLAAARALGLAWRAPVVGYPTLALLAAMARKGETLPLTVCTAGGHGEWFVQNFDARGLAEDAVQSLSPDEAARHAPHARVAGSRATPLVDLRGFGQACDLLPDARCWPLLDPSVTTASLNPLYGRPPDARLPPRP